MASRHHHACSRRQNHHNQIPLVATSSRCCTFRDSPPCCTHSNHPPPPPPQLPDNLLHLVASYLQTQQQGTHFPDQTCSCNHNNVPREHDHVILSCLLHKINNLESSLNNFASFDDQRRHPYSTLRDSAARVIQTHFRSYLVRRSISFRHLKELAMIKSSFLSLKSSVSGKTHFPYKFGFGKAKYLLRQVDSIQGRIDPMIRSSKRSLSRDLVRFLQYIDDCAVTRYGFVGSHIKKPQAFGVAEDRRVEKFRNRVGKVYVTCDGDEELDSVTDDSEEVYVDKRKTVSSKLRTKAIVKGNNVVKAPVRNRNMYEGYGNKHGVASSAEDDSVDSGEEDTLVMSRGNERKQHGLKNRNMVGGGKNRVVKTVRFDENGNVYKVYGDTPESSIIEEDDSTSDGDGEEKGNGNEVEEIKYVPKENEGTEEEGTHSENEVSSSDGSEEDAKDAINRGSNEHKKREIQLQKGSLMFSPPLPLKMEP